MAMISLPNDQLRFGDKLPFGLYDRNGLLLVPCGASIADRTKFERLRTKALFVTESEADVFRRWQGAPAEALMAQGHMRLEHIAQARVVGERRNAPAVSEHQRKLSLSESFEQLMRTVHIALRDARPSAEWLLTMEDAMDPVRTFARTRPEHTLFLLFQHLGHDTTHYNAHHSTLCAVVAAQVARTLRWPEDRIRSLVSAAFTMNVTVSALQDELAGQATAMRADQQQQVQQHPTTSAELLEGAGVTDTLWLDLVRLHHDADLRTLPMDTLSDTQRLARLLYTVDQFTARISLRASRAPMPPLLAAQDTCVGADGRPDDLGAALIRTIGMYPPGSYVELYNREMAVVLSRGQRVNEPVVAAIVGSSGMALTQPSVRHTTVPARAVKGAVPSKEIRVRLQIQRVLDLI